MCAKEILTKAEKTRLFIIKESATLFNQKGYSGTSLQDIMEVTGFTKGALYGHFKNKQEISVAAFQFAVKQVRWEIGKRTHIIENSLDKLKAVVYFYKENILSPPVKGGCPIMNTSIEADDNNPVLREKVIEALDYWQERIEYTIKKGKNQKEIKKNVDSKEFASLFISTLEGGVMMTNIYKKPIYFEVVSTQLLKMIEEIRN